ncbi:MAG: protein translocase subunit SecD [Deltaproteobacteria bacterium]|nr:protein translocase subunit SecD [Deltaproteobacteria bacterium]
MTSSWRNKIYLVLALILLSLYALMPSILGLQSRLEEAEAKGRVLKTWEKTLAWILPQKELNLGLDLRGGIYLELEVSVQEAVSNRLDLIASQTQRYLSSEKIPNVIIERVPKTDRIRALLPNEVALKKLSEYLSKNYSNSLVLQKESNELTYQSEQKDEASLQALVGSLNEKLAPLGALEIERSTGSDTFRVVLPNEAKREEIKQKIASDFKDLKEKNEPGKVVYKPSDAYLNTLHQDSVKQAVETIRNRIDRYGVAEPSIRKLGTNRIAVELPGVSDPARAISIVKQSGKLEFKLVDDSKMTSPQHPRANNEIQDLIAKARVEKKIPEGFSAESVNQINEALKGKISSDSEIAFELQTDPIKKKVVAGTPYVLKRKAEVTGDMLRGAQVSVGNEGPYVSLSFNPIGAKLFGELTAANAQKGFLAIILDGNVMSAPFIKVAIPNGEAQITLGAGDYNTQLQEAENLSLVLREGALPASLKEITKTIIGPSLGKNAIHEGLRAALIAALVVVAFMILYYKASGLIADVVLGVNVLLIMGVLAMFQATLTLPGIAGIALTMAMALDANIIIFERIREEIKSGKPIKIAVNAGFSNALTAVIDTHLTTFLSGIVLYQFGTGPIRGFAVTLMIGVVTTLLTAYWVTHLIYEYWIQKKNPETLSI